MSAVSSAECPHPVEKLRRRVVSNGVTHFVRQCLTCGRASNAISRKTLTDEEADAAPAFDEELHDRFWQEQRRMRLAEIESRRTSEKSEWDAWYDEYLHSPEWWDKREAVIKRAGGTCEGCLRRRASEVHHTPPAYEHAGQEFLFQLVALCGDCHDRIHGRGRYQRRDDVA